MSSVTLCLHGLGASQESFNRLREVGLGPNRQMIALDFAGFGRRFADPVSDDPLTAAARLKLRATFVRRIIRTLC